MTTVLLTIYNFTSRNMDILNEAFNETKSNSLKLTSQFEICKFKLFENSENYLENFTYDRSELNKLQESGHVVLVQHHRAMNQITKFQKEIQETIVVMETFKAWHIHYRKQLTSLNNRFNILTELMKDLSVLTSNNDF